jgi:PncC family amidohydrolase
MEECDFTNLPGSPQGVRQAEKTAEALIHKLKETSRTLVLAESCTAGLVSDILARIPGVSTVLWGSFVCYTEEAKVSMLGIDQERLNANGLVSKETAKLMTLGALQKSNADIAASVTGFAGPTGDPAGMVWIASAMRGGSANAEMFHFEGSRNEVRMQAAITVLEMVLERLNRLDYNPIGG